jgi:hypothetical protein
MKWLSAITLCVLLVASMGCSDDTDSTGPAGSTGDENQAPILSGPESVMATLDELATFEIAVTDADGDELELTVVPLISLSESRLGIRPGTASVDGSTGEVTFTPNANDVPERYLRITAKDPDGAAAQIDVLVLVDDPMD